MLVILLKKFLIGIKKNREKVIVLFNGIQRSVEEFPLKKQVIFVGRIVREKGVHLYLNAIKKVAKYYNDWNFLLIGSYKLGDKKNQHFLKLF